LSCLLLLLISCDSSSVYKETFDFSKNQWYKKDAKSFEFEIKDDTKFYDIDFIVSHVYDYQFKSIPITFSITKPDGTNETKPIDFILKDENGKEIGDCAGDYCDLKQNIFSKTKLQKGKYKVIVSNTFHFDYLPNIILIGLDVSVAK
jgi:gliding motility-associated lipoprotein GldH